MDQEGEVNFSEDRDQDDKPDQEMVYAHDKQEPRDGMAETLDALPSSESPPPDDDAPPPPDDDAPPPPDDDAPPPPSPLYTSPSPPH